MTVRRRLTDRPATQENLVEMTNREYVPVLKQVTKAVAVTGSRGGATAAILASLLTILSNAGIITDQTTP